MTCKPPTPEISRVLPPAIIEDEPNREVLSSGTSGQMRTSTHPASQWPPNLNQHDLLFAWSLRKEIHLHGTS